MEFLARFSSLIAKHSAAKRKATGSQLGFLDAWFGEASVEDFINLYYALEDTKSKDTLFKNINNRIALFLGSSFWESPFSKEDWKKMAEAAKSHPFALPSYDDDLVETWVLDGYNYEGICNAEVGDVVLDCGAFTGNTVINFALKVGPTGQVHAFEPMPETAEALAKNLADYKNVSCYNYAICEQSENIKMTPIANCSSHKAKGGITAKGISIDDWVAGKQLARLDFIKMDIEGCELEALRGAAATLKRHQPKLAICVYHRPDDLVAIPRYINQVYGNCSFYLKHNSNGLHELVLFAIPKTEDGEKTSDHSQEAKICSELWKVLKSSALKEMRDRRKGKMAMREALMKYAYGFPDGWIKDEQESRYMYWPLSSDQRLHFEFYQPGATLVVALHFEGMWAKETEAMREIAAASELQTPLKVFAGPLPGVGYELQNPDDHERVVGTMRYLIDISLPVLRKRGLLSDQAYLTLRRAGQ